MKPPPKRPRIALPFFLVALTVLLCMAWADSVKYLVTDPEDYCYFPPFVKYESRLSTDHLGAEYFEIAKALRKGRGFADPFKVESGPTAWMPPVFPYLQAGVLWAADDDEVDLKYVIVGFQTLTLIFTGWLVLAGTARAARTREAVWAAAGLFIAFLAYDFKHAFQTTHDTWLIALAIDLLLLGFAMLPERPRDWRSAAAWGCCGGAAALCGPVLGLVWAGLTVLRWPWAWRRWAIAGLAAGMVLMPWTVRNYLTFGRIIPVKPNLFYELYQSQCLTTEGLVGAREGFPTHPWQNPGKERRRYVELGEMKFLDEKKTIFLAAFRKAPDDYCVRVWNRFAAATLIYVPFGPREQEKLEECQIIFGDIIHPLAFFAAVVLLICPRPRHQLERAAIWTYAAWLLPYVLSSYYGRYGFPLIGVKVFLCACAVDRLLGTVFPKAGRIRS